jgi:hypothetical protein
LIGLGDAYNAIRRLSVQIGEARISKGWRPVLLPIEKELGDFPILQTRKNDGKLLPQRC